jgi:hypothetical protein
MTWRRIPAILAGLLSFAALTSAEPPQGPLTIKNYDDYRRWIVPDARESAWAKVPWRGTFWEGLVEAQKKDKPILLWSYGGDPLGSC